MTSVTNTRSGELVISAPEREIDAFLVEAEKEGLCDVYRLAGGCTCGGTAPTTNGMKKPTPLGIPTLNFRREPERKEQPEQSATNAGSTRGLGIPTLRF